MKVKTCISLMLLSGSMLLSPPAQADFAEGFAAYKNKDYSTALREYEAGASKGEANAMLGLGDLYYYGQGVDKDTAQAFDWYRKAADLGSAIGQETLGFAYYKGDDLVRDLREAAWWFRKAAEQGRSRSQTMLGAMYIDGTGVQQDYEEAAKWYRKAADGGVAFAQRALGMLYAAGQGVEQDDSEAVKWYRKAAERGDADGQNSLGVAYATGKGVEQNPPEAVKWYRKAAEQGNAFAQSNLGFRYLNGEGVAQDQVLAYALFALSAAGGNEQATGSKNELVSSLTAPQLKEGEELAQWKVGTPFPTKSKTWVTPPDPAPFGLELGKATVAQAKAKYRLKSDGTNKYSQGPMFKVEPSSVQLDGLQQMTLIFNKQQVLVGVMTTLPKAQFKPFHEMLSKKYRVTSEEVPFVGDASVKYKSGGTQIELDAPHLSFQMSMNYFRNELLDAFKQQEELEQKAKQKATESQL